MPTKLFKLDAARSLTRWLPTRIVHGVAVSNYSHSFQTPLVSNCFCPNLTGERRRSEKVQPSQTRLGFPPGTASRATNEGNFSHIQVVTKDPSEEQALGETTPQPTFRKPSLVQEAEAALETPLANPSTNSPESLAKNIQGATFAAKARAAELHAARARKVMKAQLTGELDGSTAIPHETMTFKSKSKSARTWKRIDLSDLPESFEEEEDATQTLYEEQEPNLGVVNDSAQSEDSDLTRADNSVSIQGKEPQVNEFSTSSLRLPTDSFYVTEAMRTSPRLSYTMNKGLAPATANLVKSLDDYDSSTWSSRQFSPGPGGEEQMTDIGGNFRGTTQGLSATSITSTCPVSRPSTAVQMKIHRARRAQEQQNLELQQMARNLPLMMSSLNVMGKQRKDSTAVALKNLSQETIPATADFFHDDFQIIEPETLSLKAPRPQIWNTYNQTPRLTPLPSKPLHHYPAVKGTIGKDSQFPAAGPHQQRFGSNDHPTTAASQQKIGYSQTQAYSQAKSSPGLQAIGPPTRKVSGKTFTEANKTGLLRQLHNVAESAIKLEAPSSRTVMHDPYAHNGLNPTCTNPESRSPSGADLCGTSDALPWKERPVEVLTHASTAGGDYPILFGHVMRPDGCFPIDEAPEMQGTGKCGRKKALDEADKWFNSDNRFNNSGRDVALLMGRVKAEEQRTRGKELSDHAALRRANFPNDKIRALPKTTAETETANTNAMGLLAPVLANLASYSTRPDYFSKFGEVPEWCRDHGPRGNESFFGEDWGAPPPRLGRDPRYRPVQHEGRGSSHLEGSVFMYPETRSPMHRDVRNSVHPDGWGSTPRPEARNNASQPESRNRAAALEWQNQDYVRWKG